jgi:DNA replication protein DnaC
MTRDQLVLQLQQEYATRREENLRAYDAKVDGVCAQCPGLKSLIDARHAALLSGMRFALYPEKRNPLANEGLTAKLVDYNGRIAASLTAGGLLPDALNPIFTCAECRDEGYVYDPTRRMCACFENELNRRMLVELGLRDEQTFERFREDYFSDDGDVSQRSTMRRNRDVCQRYADTYPNTEVRDLLFTGKSGLGKTFLMQAIAHRVTERGFGVQYVSAYKLLDTMRKAYFENSAERLRPLIEAPLLLVDDLGTEPLMENITVTQLFNLLNERQNADRHTILSTNLNISELKTRYTERITSRLLEARRCKVLKFVGDDIRQRLGKSEGDGT